MQKEQEEIEERKQMEKVEMQKIKLASSTFKQIRKDRKH